MWHADERLWEIFLALVRGSHGVEDPRLIVCVLVERITVMDCQT